MNKNIISRKIICFLLCLMIVMPVMLSSCGETKNEDDALAPNARTLVITMIKEEGMTDEAVLAVQNALNGITEGKFNTHIELRMFTADEYQSEILKMSEKLYINTLEESGTKYVSNKIIFEEGKEYFLTSNGDYKTYSDLNIPKTVYPHLVDTQLDIILINNINTYNKLVNGKNGNPYLAELGTVISDKGALLKKYVNSTALTHAGKTGLKLYAVPNNNVYGEFSYMVINKKLFDELDYDINAITDFSNVDDFIYDLLNKDEYKNVTPIYNFMGIDFLSIFDFVSPLAKQSTTAYDSEVAVTPTNILGIGYYQTCMNMLYNVSRSDAKSYIESEIVDFDEDFGVAFMKGDPTIPTVYADRDGDGEDDYYFVTLARPFLDNSMYESMFAISAFTSDIERSFDIFSLLQTDAEVVNLLAYGIPDLNYELDSNNVVVNRKGGYNINYRYSGNNFLCYESEDMDDVTRKYASNEWTAAKEQNRYLVVSPYCGFELQSYDLSSYVFTDTEKIKNCKYVETSDGRGVTLVDSSGKTYLDSGKTVNFMYVDIMVAEYKEYCKDLVYRMNDFDAADEYESYKKYLQELKTEFEQTELYSQLTGISSSKNNTYLNSFSPIKQYYNFWTNTYRATE